MNQTFIKRELLSQFNVIEKADNIYELCLPYSYANAAAVVVTLHFLPDLVLITDSGDFSNQFGEIMARPGVSEVISKALLEFNIQEDAGEWFAVGDTLDGLGQSIHTFIHALLVADAVISLYSMQEEINKT